MTGYPAKITVDLGDEETDQGTVDPLADSNIETSLVKDITGVYKLQYFQVGGGGRGFSVINILSYYGYKHDILFIIKLVKAKKTVYSVSKCTH